MRAYGDGENVRPWDDRSFRSGTPAAREHASALPAEPRTGQELRPPLAGGLKRPVCRTWTLVRGVADEQPQAIAAHTTLTGNAASDRALGCGRSANPAHASTGGLSQSIGKLPGMVLNMTHIDELMLQLGHPVP